MDRCVRKLISNSIVASMIGALFMAAASRSKAQERSRSFSAERSRFQNDDEYQEITEVDRPTRVASRGFSNRGALTPVSSRTRSTYDSNDYDPYDPPRPPSRVNRSLNSGAGARYQPSARLAAYRQPAPADQRPSLIDGATRSQVAPRAGAMVPYYPAYAAPIGPNTVARGSYPGGCYPVGGQGIASNVQYVGGPYNSVALSNQQAPYGNIQPLGQYDSADPGAGWGWGENRGASSIWRPLIPIKAFPQNYSLGQGIIGQPKVFVHNQPVRNFIRYITP